MKFANILKGRLAESILVSLLERGGYRVTRLGVEELFDEVKYLDHSAYLGLGLPDQLRTLPDLLVADPTVQWARLIEVKYRRRFDLTAARDLYRQLQRQREYWSNSYAVVMIGESFVPEGRFHQDYIRVVPPGKESSLVNFPRQPVYSDEQHAEVVWDSLSMLTSLFKFKDFEDAFGEEAGLEKGRDFWTQADYITRAIKHLRGL